MFTFSHYHNFMAVDDGVAWPDIDGRLVLQVMLCQANARYDDVDRFPVEIHNRMQSPPGKEFYSSFLRGASRDRAKHIPNNGLLNLKIITLYFASEAS